MSSSESRVTFGKVPGGPSRRFGPSHRSSRPARSIMRRPKLYARHGHVNPRVPQDISNRPLTAMKSIASSPHLVHYVGSRRHGHSNVFAFSPVTSHVIRPSISLRHNRRSSHSSSSSKSSHHHRVSLPASLKTTQLYTRGHERHHSDGSASHGHKHRSATVHHSHHRKHSSIDSSHSHASSASQPIRISPRQYSGYVQTNPTPPRSIASPFLHSGSPFNLQGLGYALPSIPYAVQSPPHSTPSPPSNTYTDSAYLPGIVEVDPWTQAPSLAVPPQDQHIHLHSELVYGTGHMIDWNMMLPPSTAISAFSDPSSNMIIYSGVRPSDPVTKDLLRSPACPGAAKIIIRPRHNNQALVQWMNGWGPLEIYPSSLTFENEITVYEVLYEVHSYFQARLSPRAVDDMGVESRERIMHARSKRVALEGHLADETEWARPPKRVDVLSLWSAFGGFDVCYNQGGRYNTLDEPGWRVVELELRLRSI
ncbi:hypothetical protein EV360DRAFT_65562 [Lentinula raphanica]|nr:hypothetical protein EV360DRAFT_65562 [Lentinula raphanica]